tara:strand:- start:55 stop:789 length:735 start_codon:yes stop_codon:yes gene_type:complete
MSRFPSYDPSMGITQDQYSQQITKTNEQLYGGGLSNLPSMDKFFGYTMSSPGTDGLGMQSPGGFGATVMSYYRRKKPDGTYEYHQTGNTAQPAPSGEGWERSSQEFPGQHGDIDPEWRKEWEKKYGKPDVSRPAVEPLPDLSILNPFMPDIDKWMPEYPDIPIPRPDPSLNPFQPPVQLPEPPSPPVSPRPEPKPEIQFSQLPTGQQASNLSYSEGPSLIPPAIRLKHGGSLTDKVLHILRNLS